MVEFRHRLEDKNRMDNHSRFDIEHLGRMVMDCKGLPCLSHLAKLQKYMGINVINVKFVSIS